MKLYRFPYSCFARKVQMALDLCGESYSTIDVPYCDRSELVALTGGYMHVPVLLLDDGTVITDSRNICRRFAAKLVPSPWEGPIWATADWIESELEDILFRVVAPGLRDHFGRATERALFTLIKERRYGAGCLAEWEARREEYLARARERLAPILSTLAARPWLFGDQPTLADAALYGQLAMFAAAGPVSDLDESLPGWMARLEAACPTS